MFPIVPLAFSGKEWVSPVAQEGIPESPVWKIKKNASVFSVYTHFINTYCNAFLLADLESAYSLIWGTCMIWAQECGGGGALVLLW